MNYTAVEPSYDLDYGVPRDVREQRHRTTHCNALREVERELVMAYDIGAGNKKFGQG